LPGVAAVSLLLWAGGAAAAAGRQQQEREDPQARFGERVDVVEVLIDVQVTDRKGVVVLGLGPDDFTALVDGEPTPISSVSFHSPYFAQDIPERIEGRTGTFGALPAEGVTQPPEHRYFVLLFHDLMAPDFETLGVTAQQSLAVAMARQWVRRELLPADFVAVASYDYKLKIHSDFGRDPDELERALKRAMMRRDPERSGRVNAASAGPSLVRTLPRGPELRDRSRNIRQALWVLAEGLRPLHGRKNLLLFSIGVGLTPYLGPVLNRSNVDVYTVDISPPHAQHMQAVALEGLARATGGHFFRWGSYFDSLQRVSRATTGYYQLSVPLTRGVNGELPERVVVNVVHRELRVMARRHYTGDEEAEAVPGGALFEVDEPIP
jgi:VWFA-related protein